MYNYLMSYEIEINTQSGKWLRWAALAAVGIFFICLAISMLSPVDDPDFWWHLASGKWTWQNKALMGSDPFGFTDFGSGPPERSSFILKQYWLAQLIMYATYSAGGFGGVLALRLITMGLMFYLLYALMRRQGVGIGLAATGVFLAAMVIVREIHYVGDRPQIFTSLFAVLIVWVLEALRDEKRWGRPGLPLMMLLWSNLHGGYVLGDMVIAMYLFVAIIFRNGSKWFYISSALALLASGINPNGFNAFLTVFSMFGEQSTAAYWSSVVESQSLFSHATVAGIIRQMPYVSALIGLSALSFLLNIANIRSMKKQYILLYVFGLLMGYKAIRFMIFTSAFSALFMCVNLQGAWDKVAAWIKVERFKGVGVWVSLVIVLALAAFMFKQGLPAARYTLKHPVQEPYADAVKFMRQNDLRGNIFNDYSAGGYLIWGLAPYNKIFTDGRGLDMQAFDIFRAVVAAPTQPISEVDSRTLYQALMDRFFINAVVLPGCDQVSGVTLQLSLRLLKDPSWAMVYADNATLIFLRDFSGYRDFISAHRQHSDEAYNQIINCAKAASQGEHSSMMPSWMLSLAIGHQGKGELLDASQWLSMYLLKAPNDPMALDLKMRIERSGVPVYMATPPGGLPIGGIR